MPDIYKVGVTLRSPADRLQEANSSDTWRPPTPYSQVVAKRVRDAPAKEKRIHAILDDRGYRIHPRREFFNAPIGFIRQLFDLMDDCVEEVEVEVEVDVDSDSDEESVVGLTPVTETVNKRFADDIRRCLDAFRQEHPTVIATLSCELYKYYMTWCETNGVMCVSHTLFGRLLVRDIGLIRQHTSSGKRLFLNNSAVMKE